jgi:hypothetical protein
MSIVSCPDDTTLSSAIQCVICQDVRTYADVSAGMLNTDGQQAFACDDHFRDGNRLYAGWIQFVVEERTRQLNMMLLPWDEDYDAQTMG